MVVIKNTFYQRGLLLPLVKQAQDSIQETRTQFKENQPVGEMIENGKRSIIYDDPRKFTLDNISFALSSITYALSVYITQEDASYALEKMKELSELSPVYQYDQQSVDTFLESAQEVETEVKEATEYHHELMKLLSRYHNLVGASHTIAGHGKSWEPSITITSIDDQHYEVEFCAYQAGDQQEEPIRGTLHEIIPLVEHRIDNIEASLLTGMTNTNPLVMMMNEDNTSDTVKVFKELEKEIPYAYEHIFFDHHVFLPDATSYPVSFTGYVEQEVNQYATIATEYSYYPSARSAIGLEKLEHDSDDQYDFDY